MLIIIAKTYFDLECLLVLSSTTRSFKGDYAFAVYFAGAPFSASCH